MTNEEAAPASSSINGLYLPILGVFLLSVPVLAAVSQPKLMQASDYLMNFFVAGRLVVEGRATQLYPSATDTSFLTTAFNQFAHSLLPHLPPGHVSIYMYSPLIAVIFAPFSMLPPADSMVVWQLTSMVAFFACAFLIAKVTKQSVISAVKHGIFYLPVFDTLLIGHLGIAVGMLPLTAGYFLLLKKKEFLAGFCWGLLLLKPQFLPVALLVAGAQALNRNFRCALGLAAGAGFISVLTVVCLTPAVMQQWIATLKMSDTIFSDPRYAYPAYLVNSLPAVLLHFFPVGSRNPVKLVAYGIAGCVGLHALWVATRRLSVDSQSTDKSDDAINEPISEHTGDQVTPRTNEETRERNLEWIFLLGICVLPLVLPHFLYYDLSILCLFGMIAHGSRWNENERTSLNKTHWIYLLSVNAYMLAFMFANKALVQPAVLVAIMIYAYIRVLGLPQASGQRAQGAPPARETA